MGAVGFEEEENELLKVKVTRRSLRRTVLFSTYCTMVGQSLQKTYNLSSLGRQLSLLKMKTTSVLGSQHDSALLLCKVAF